MTLRAVLLGLLGALAIAGFGFINDSVLRLTPIVGNYFPISVFGVLIFLVIAVNGPLAKWRPNWRLRPGELATLVTFMLIACSIPGSGLMRTFTPILAMPVEYEQTKLDWQKTNVLNRLPEGMLVPRIPSEEDPRRLVPDPDVMGPLATGYANTGEPLPLTEIFSSRIPWRQWSKPLAMWVPLVLLLAFGSIGLSLVIHPQWSKREHLRYPIADVAATLMQDDATSKGSLLRDRLFWLGLGGILAIHLINGLHAWYPESIEVPMYLNLWPIANTWPWLRTWNGSNSLFWVEFFPTVIAFAFFLSSDVSFSIGISRLLPSLALPPLILQGVSMGGPYIEGGPQAWAMFGSFLGVGLLLLYTGRSHYLATVRCALTGRRDTAVESYAIWGCRAFLACVIGMFLILVFRMELAWTLALLLIFLIFLVLTVLSRMSAETGLFFLQPAWVPLTAMLACLGASSMGPKAILVVGMVSAILVIDPRESLMPFVINGLKICDMTKVRTSRMGWTAPIIFAVALAVALPIILWSNYQHGMPMRDVWSTTAVPQMPFDTAARAVEELRNNDQLEASEQRGALGRLSGLWSTHPQRSRFLWSAGLGFALVIVVSVLRLRYAWWPIHPILFLVWASWPAAAFSASFLIGWAIRTVVEKFGGTQAYRRARILMIGCIAGDLLGGLIFMVHGGIYHAVTGLDPVAYCIFPQ